MSDLRRLPIACVLAMALTSACASPPPSHLTRLWPGGRSGEPVLGLSTEDGVLILSSPFYQVGDVFEMQFPVGNSLVSDLGTIDRLNDDLAVVKPASTKLSEGRLASSPPLPGESLYLALRDALDQPVLEEVARWHDGALGDFIRVSGRDPAQTARSFAGAGLYVKRTGRWRVVGMLAGITARRTDGRPDDVGLGYIGLLEMARILPDQGEYGDPDVSPLRPDIEYGVPLQSGTVEGEHEGPAGDGGR